MESRDWSSDVCSSDLFPSHDTRLESRLIKPKEIKETGIIYLENGSVVIDGFKFWGSPVTPTFGDWAFMRARDKTNKLWQTIPEDTDVLVVHGPPKGVRDLSYDRFNNLEMCGDSALAKRCYVLKDNLKYVCFGHIHDMDGVDNQGISKYSKTPTIFSNAVCVHDGRFDKGLTSFGNILNL